MAKVLNTTVHLTDDKGEEQVFKSGDTLPAWAEKKLAESWPADRDDLWSSGGTDEAEPKRPADKAGANASSK